ncbi:MAG: hypothetical protein R2815_10725 [Flavobacteriales bacterium]
MEWTWQLDANAQGYFQQAMFLEPDGQGNVYGARTFDGTIDMNGIVLSGSRDIVVAKWNSAGEVLWARRVGGMLPPQVQDDDAVTDLAYDSANDELTVVGTHSTTLEFDHDTLLGGGVRLYSYVARYASNGECLWARRGTGDYTYTTKVKIDGSSTIHVFGGSSTGVLLEGDPSINIPSGGYLSHYSEDGDLLGAELIVSSGSVHGSTQLANDAYVIAGNGSGSFLGDPIASSGSPSTGFLSMTNLVDEVEWLIPFRSSVGATVSEPLLLGTDRLVVKGIFYEDLILPTDTLHSLPGTQNAYIACFNLEGELLWLTQLASPEWSAAGWGFSVDENGNSYFIGDYKGSVTMGSVSLSASTSSQGLIAKFDTTGVCRAAWDYGRVRGGAGSLLYTNDGIYFSCAYDSVCTIGTSVIDPPIAWSGSMFIAKIDSLVGFTGVQSLGEIGGGALHIYANPTNGLCTVDLPESLRISNGLVLSVFDNLGQLVQRAPLEFTDIGLRLDVRAQAKGVYHVELGDGIQRYTGTIVFE